MVDTSSVNGDEALLMAERHLPEAVEITAGEARRIPAPGTQRELRAQTGKSFEELAGPDADGADRIQTLIWMKLRRQFPGLAWDEVADVDVQVDEGVLDAVDPTRLAGSESSPPSAGSGG